MFQQEAFQNTVKWLSEELENEREARKTDLKQTQAMLEDWSSKNCKLNNIMSDMERASDFISDIFTELTTQRLFLTC